VFNAAAGFDGNEFLPRSRIAYAECGSNRGSPDEGADLENIAGANFCKVVNENQHVQMQHGIFVADFEQLRMNRFVSILHKCMHQVQALVELIAGL
jgi:hypothetical protein